ncbi:hypothetical protein PR001_g8575 [Phytophthora rubi]|uniref:Uncharacterized protein n=1 Tax=Phytophthora rubi TaxID=129364 RepID=A0A6A3N6W4_9STRA|nr:hypothetical protein PR001_g8575 [Phytophthora rubi]
MSCVVATCVVLPVDVFACRKVASLRVSFINSLVFETTLCSMTDDEQPVSTRVRKRCVPISTSVSITGSDFVPAGRRTCSGTCSSTLYE